MLLKELENVSFTQSSALCRPPVPLATLVFHVMSLNSGFPSFIVDPGSCTLSYDGDRYIAIKVLISMYVCGSFMTTR